MADSKNTGQGSSTTPQQEAPKNGAERVSGGLLDLSCRMYRHQALMNGLCVALEALDELDRLIYEFDIRATSKDEPPLPQELRPLGVYPHNEGPRAAVTWALAQASALAPTSEEIDELWHLSLPTKAKQ
jgi:hypothetical protein